MMKEKRWISLFSVILFALTARAQELPYVLTKDLRIPMQDGVMLGGALVMPKGTTNGPVVLVVNCYPTEQDPVGMYTAVSRSGFIMLEVHTRGKGLSEGVFEPFVNDAKDNYEIIEWVSKQPWCNGKVAMGGGSYLGTSQWAALKKVHPALKSIVPMVSAAPGVDFLLKNNMFYGYTLRWIDRVTSNKFDATEKFSGNHHWYSLYNTIYQNGYAYKTLDSLDGKQNPFFRKIIEHPSYDGFWKDMIPSSAEEFSKIDLPVLTITGYFDGGQRGAMYYYNMHNAFGKPDAVQKHFLLIGPYTHSGAQSVPAYSIGGYKIDSAAVVNMRLLNLQWFGHVLNGKPRPAILKNRVNCFVMGSGWKHASSLSELANDTVVLHLQTGKNKFHVLSAKAPGKNQSFTIDFNPLDRSDSIDVAKTEVRLSLDDVPPFTEEYLNTTQQLIFDSAPFGQDVDLVGSPVADLFFEFSGLKDCDLQIAWYEVSADNKSFPLSNQSQRLSYHHNKEKRELLNPQTTYHVTFADTYFIAKRISKGSRIRFVVKVLNDPAWQKNYGSGKDVSDETLRDATPGTIKLLSGKKFPSAILLPINKTRTVSEKTGLNNF